MNNENVFLVSVIIPNYCHSKYLEQRIQSVLNQTYQNFELIILDDASPDDGASKKVIEKYRDNPHVSNIVYNEKNSGSTFKQWDLGFSLAKGDLIWVAESDDYCESTLLENLVNEFYKDKQLVLTYCLSQKVDSDGNPLKMIERTPHGVTRLTGDTYIRRYMSFENHCNNASACLFKKSVLHSIPSSYTTFKACGDMFFWICIAQNGNVSIINHRLSYFRQHNNKVTSKSHILGINAMEFHRIYRYLIETIGLSNLRRKIVSWNVAYSILEGKYANEQIKEILCKEWGITGINVFQKAIVKMLAIMRHRMAIYL